MDITTTQLIIFFSLLSIVFLSILLFLIFAQNQIKKRLHQLITGNDIQQKNIEHLSVRFDERTQNNEALRHSILQLLNEQQQEQHKQRARFDEHQIKSLTVIQDSLQKGMVEIRQQVNEALKLTTDALTKSVDKLTQATDKRLQEISGQVDKRLAEGFEKTTATFTDMIKRLALIDEAQKKITELSTNVVSLQEILADKRSRGTFGEVQLNGLIRNVLPEQHFSLQHTLSNGKRVDCILFLPEPSGNIAIDAKFPLENYHRIMDIRLSESEHKIAEQQFRNDIRKHIHDISEKYIITGETADGAVMFIPAEAIFAEIHAHYPELVEESHKAKVWMVSPTTLMAILTTARAVLKDEATRKQVHIIRDHLIKLGDDFQRFQKRMDNLAIHIDQAHRDVEQVHRSSQKITSRFNKIEKVDLTNVTNQLDSISEESEDRC